MTTTPQPLPAAKDLGLVPGLAPEELQRIYRALARQYHPDSGRSASESIMRHINVLYDELKQGSDAAPQPELGEPEEFESAAPAAAAAHAAYHKARFYTRTTPESGPGPDPEASMGELFFTEQARVLMSEALIGAVDRWLETAFRIPRNRFRRLVMRRLRRIAPVPCPGLHMPQRVSMTRTTLRFHFATTPVGGLNFIALPALSNDGLRLVPSGSVPVLQETLALAQETLVLPPERLRERGFALALDGQALPVKLLFDPVRSEVPAGFYRLPERRYRGLLIPASIAPAGPVAGA